MIVAPSALREARAMLGLTQQRLSDALGLSGSRVVRRWEAGERTPGGPTLIALARMLRDRRIPLPEWARDVLDAAS